MKVLSIGATGSIGVHVVSTLIEAGHEVRALVRNKARALTLLPADVQVVVGDATNPSVVSHAVEGADAVIFTHGSHGSVGTSKDVEYGIVKNVLESMRGRKIRIVLMTSIGVTSEHAPEEVFWKRRSERLLRASGQEYTIVRPAWFDYNKADQLALQFLQGDTHRTATPRDGAIARKQIARVLVESLTTPSAAHKTLELRAEHGAEQEDLEPLFSRLKKDTGIDGVLDNDTLPAKTEPHDVLADLDAIPLEREL